MLEKLTEIGAVIRIIACHTMEYTKRLTRISSLNYSIPDILGSVWYNELNDLDFDFKELLGKIAKRNRKMSIHN